MFSIPRRKSRPNDTPWIFLAGLLFVVLAILVANIIAAVEFGGTNPGGQLTAPRGQAQFTQPMASCLSLEADYPSYLTGASATLKDVPQAVSDASAILAARSALAGLPSLNPAQRDAVLTRAAAGFDALWSFRMTALKQDPANKNFVATAEDLWGEFQNPNAKPSKDNQMVASGARTSAALRAMAAYVAAIAGDRNREAEAVSRYNTVAGAIMGLQKSKLLAKVGKHTTLAAVPGSDSQVRLTSNAKMVFALTDMTGACYTLQHTVTLGQNGIIFPSCGEFTKLAADFAAPITKTLYIGNSLQASDWLAFPGVDKGSVAQQDTDAQRKNRKGAVDGDWIIPRRVNANLEATMIAGPEDAALIYSAAVRAWKNSLPGLDGKLLVPVVIGPLGSEFRFLNGLLLRNADQTPVTAVYAGKNAAAGAGTGEWATAQGGKNQFSFPAVSATGGRKAKHDGQAGVGIVFALAGQDLAPAFLTVPPHPGWIGAYWSLVQTAYGQANAATDFSAEMFSNACTLGVAAETLGQSPRPAGEPLPPVGVSEDE